MTAPGPAPGPAPPPGDRDVRDAAIFGGWTAFSRVLGLGRTWLQTAAMGATVEADAFNAAYKLVNFFRIFLGEGALGNALLPLLKELERTDPERARELAARAARLATALATAIILVAALFVRTLVDAYVPGMSPEGRALTVGFALIMAPYLPCIAATSVLMTPMQAQRRHAVNAWHPILFNLALIASALVPDAWMSDARAFAFGVLAGGLLQAGYLIHHCRRAGVDLFGSPALGLGDPAMRELLALTGPSLAGVAMVRVASLADTWFASSLPEGSVTCLATGTLCFTAVLGISGVGIGTVYATPISEAVAAGDAGAVRAKLAEGSALILALSIPATALGVVWPGAVAEVFRFGRFDARSAEILAAAIRGAFLGLPFASLYYLYSRAHYAHKRQTMVVVLSTVAAALNVALCWVWTRALAGGQLGPSPAESAGVLGLAGASSAAHALLVAGLGVRLGDELPGRAVAGSLGRCTGIAVLAGLPTALVPGAGYLQLLRIPVFGLLYLGIHRMMDTPEWTLLMQVRRRPRRESGEDHGAGQSRGRAEAPPRPT